MNESNIDQLQQAEAEFFNESARRRSLNNAIPMSADIRRATRVVGRPGFEPIDPAIFDMQQKYYRDRYLELVAHKPGGRVLDIGCGPGWLALELGRRGQHVDAYDLSPLAIDIAERMLKENPYTDGFGSVTYHLKDVSTVDLGEDTYDAVSGWSAFHHLPDFFGFMSKVRRALRPSGVIATLDDYEVDPVEMYLGRLFGLLLPTADRSYVDKVRAVMRRLSGTTVDVPEVFSPMEQAKYSTVEDIENVWREQYDLIEDFPFGAFSLAPALKISGPSWFRYRLAWSLINLDKILVRSGLLKGRARILISRKISN